MLKYALVLIVIVITFASVVQEPILKQKQSVQKSEISIKYYLFSEKCFNQYFSKMDFGAPSTCYKFTISKIVGYLIVFLSATMKIPQILIIFKNKSVQGLTFMGNNQQFLMTALAAGFGIYAHLPFSVYGENIFFIIQNFIILVQFIIYLPKQRTKNITYLILNLLFSSLFVFQVVPPILQQISIWLQLLLIILARGSQFITNYQTKSTQNLSIVPYIMAASGNTIRIFTILIETPNQFGFLMNAVIPLIINSSIILQCILYKSKKEKEN